MKNRMPVMLLVLMMFSGVSLAGDHFLFDLEKNKILFMGTHDLQFVEKIDMDKNPDLMLQTDNPDKYLALYLPAVAKEAKDAVPGQLVLFNTTSGRTEDLVELGFAPYHWVYTNDRKHLFITYRTSLKDDKIDLIDYFISEGKVENLTNVGDVQDLTLSKDESKLYVLASEQQKKDDKEGGRVLALSYQPLAIQSTLLTEETPSFLCSFSNDRYALIDGAPREKGKNGSLKIVNALDNSIIKKVPFKPYKRYAIEYFDTNNSLIVILEDSKDYSFKVNENDIQPFEFPHNPIDYHYFPDKDQLYVLTTNNLVVFDYPASKMTMCDTDGANRYKSFDYTFYRIPNSDLATIFCPNGGRLKFFDLKENKVSKNVAYGRIGAKFGNFMVNFLANVAFNSALNSFYRSNGISFYGGTWVNFQFYRQAVSVASDEEQDRFYVLSNATRDITVFDRNFERLDYIVPEEAPQAMFLVKKPKLQTIVVSRNMVYRLDTISSTLAPIHKFKESVMVKYLLEEDQRLFIICDKELLVLDSDTLQVKNEFMLYGDPEEKYKKLKKGEQRYYFIPTL